MDRNEAPPKASGDVLAERYRLEELLGQGGMGTVWAAVDLETGGRVAVKLVRDGNASPEARKRLIREARAAATVKHPNVVVVRDVIDLDGGPPAMVMDLLKGESLAEKLAREHRLSIEDTARIMLPVVSAVGTAHALGIIHRDLKPENIFLARAEDDRLDVKVLDFGIAKLTARETGASESTDLTASGALIGTPLFMAPEQIGEEEGVDHRADIWALGLILYQCLSGVLPTRADNTAQVLKAILTRPIWPLREAQSDVPEDVATVVDRMVIRTRAQRLSNLSELAGVLGRYSGDKAPEFGASMVPRAHDDARGYDKPRDRPPRPRLWIALVTGVAALATTGAFAVRRSGTPRPASSTAPAASQPSSLYQLTTSGDVDTVDFSPDGKSIAYATGGTIHIRREGEAAEVVFDANEATDDCYPLRFHPDGTGVFLDDTLWGLDGREIAQPKTGGDPRFSLDGRRMTYWGQPTTTINVYDRATGIKEWSVDRPKGERWLFDLDLSPSGNEIAFVTATGLATLWLAERSGGSPTLAMQGAAVVSPRWSPRGNAFYALVSITGSRALSLMKKPLHSASQTLVREITDDNNACESIAISPDNKKLAFVRRKVRSRLVFLSRQGSSWKSRTLTGGDGDYGALSASPDGTKIAYMNFGYPMEVRSLDLHTEKVLTMRSTLALHAGATAWSPDGSRLAIWESHYDGTAHVVVVPVDGQLHEGDDVACPEISGDSAHLAWTDRGEILYEKAGNQTISAVDPETRAARDFFTPKDGWIFLTSESNDGRRILYYHNPNKQAERWGFNLLDSRGDLGPHIPDTAKLDGGWVTNDSVIVRARSVGKRHARDIVAIKGKERTSLGSLPIDGYPVQMVEVQGGYVALISNDTSDVWIAENFDPDVH